MRIRKALTLTLAVGMSLAVSGIALAAGDGNVGPGDPPDPTPQGLPQASGKYQTAKFTGVSYGNPKFSSSGLENQFVSGFTKPAGKLSSRSQNAVMAVRTATGNLVGGAVNIPATKEAGIPAPAVRAQVYFDNDIVLNLAGIPRCDDVTVSGLPTPQARNACKASIVGSGTARIRVPGLFDNPVFAPGSVAAETSVELTAFLGQKDTAGNDTIILYSRAPALNSGTALIGTLVKANRPGYGRMLDVYIPVLAANAALTQFEMSVGNGRTYNNNGDNAATPSVDERALPGVGRNGFIKAKCGADKKLRIASRFYFSNYGGDNGSPSYDAAKPWTGLAADAAPDNYLDTSQSTTCKK